MSRCSLLIRFGVTLQVVLLCLTFVTASDDVLQVELSKLLDALQEAYKSGRNTAGQAPTLTLDTSSTNKTHQKLIVNLHQTQSTTTSQPAATTPPVAKTTTKATSAATTTKPKTSQKPVVVSIATPDPSSTVKPEPTTRAPVQTQNVSLIEQCIEAHNYYRSVHGAPKLKRDEKLVDWAASRVLQLMDKFEGTTDLRYGENFAMTTTRSESCWNIVKLWYDEVANYNFANATFGPNTGHFTQLVWSSTSGIGCGYRSQTNGTLLVCGYDPPGNVKGSFKDNVRPPQKAVTTTAPPKAPTTTQKPLKLDAKELKLQQQCLEAHNKFRALHNASALTLDQSIIDWAKQRSKQIVAKFGHIPNAPFGENIAMITVKDKPCADLVQMWYDEIKEYDFKTAQYGHRTGHFTQVIWKKSTKMGCGYYSIDAGTYLSCGYKPHGNVIGAFKENVQAPTKKQ